MSTEEKRSHPRFPLILSVNYPGDAAEVRDFTENLSAGGLFIRTARGFRVGDVVPLIVSFSDLLEPVELVTEVVWVRNGDDPSAPQGVAVWVPPGRDAERGKLMELSRMAREAVHTTASILRVLLVEDNALVAATYQSALRRLATEREIAGLMVERASDGSEALTRLRAQPGIDLVITDVYMPTMNGFVLLEQMHSDPRLSQIPVVVISSCNTEEQDRLARMGAKVYLQKPVKYRDIVSTVHALLTEAHLPRAASGSR